MQTSWERAAVNRSELVRRLAVRHSSLSEEDADLAVKALLEIMTRAMEAGERIELRGFGSFLLRHRQAYSGYHPRSGEPLSYPASCLPRFKAGKPLRERVNGSPAARPDVAPAPLSG